MKKTVGVVLVALFMVVLTGCVSGSHLTVGPVTAQSSVAAHEWKDPSIYAEDGKVGSTFGCFSSEMSIATSDECKGLGLGASVTWDQDAVQAYPF